MKSGTPIASDHAEQIRALCDTSRAEARLRRLLAEGETLSGAGAEVWGYGHVKFVVGKKTFAYYLNNHHDDGLLALACKSTPERQEELVSRDPERFRVPAYLGKDGWVSVRLDLRSVDWEAVRGLLHAAWEMQAPKKLKAGTKTGTPHPALSPRGRGEGAKEKKGTLRHGS